MNKLILALAGFVAVSQSMTIYDIGTYLGDLNVGAALGFQDDPTDTSTDCYVAATDTAVYIQNMFDETQYSSGAINPSEFLSLAQTAEIAVLTEFNDCHLMEFLYAINNRLTDAAFTSGLVSNIGTQISTVIGYYYGSTQTTGNVAAALLTLFNKSTLIITYNELSTYLLALDFENFGVVLVQFVTSLVNYRSANVNTGRDTM